MGVDIKKLETAILYLQRITEGKNPVNNMPADEDAVLNNPNVIRCMCFVKEILEEVKDNDGYVGRKPRKSNKLEFPMETLNSYVYQKDKSITRFVRQINDEIDKDVYQKLSYRRVRQWLKLNGYLEERMYEEYGKSFHVPTEKGLLLGIRAESRQSSTRGGYMATFYSKDAQEFIVNNIKNILNVEIEEEEGMDDEEE